MIHDATAIMRPLTIAVLLGVVLLPLIEVFVPVEAQAAPRSSLTELLEASVHGPTVSAHLSSEPPSYGRDSEEHLPYETDELCLKASRLCGLAYFTRCGNS